MLIHRKACWALKSWNILGCFVRELYYFRRHTFGILKMFWFCKRPFFIFLVQLDIKTYIFWPLDSHAMNMYEAGIKIIKMMMLRHPYFNFFLFWIISKLFKITLHRSVSNGTGEGRKKHGEKWIAQDCFSGLFLGILSFGEFHFSHLHSSISQSKFPQP